MTVNSQSLEFIENLYERFLRDPEAVPERWRSYFAEEVDAKRNGRARLGPSFPRRSLFNSAAPGVNGAATDGRLSEAALQERVDQLIRNYRVRGHRIANIDPLRQPAGRPPELEPAYYGFTEADMQRPVSTRTMRGPAVRTLAEVTDSLRETYCRYIGVQFMHIDDLDVREWLQQRMEAGENRIALSRETQLQILTRLTDAVVFEEFIQKKFLGAKSFSLEGAESLIPLLHLAIEKAGRDGIREIVLGMAHRGRLNVLANILGKSPRQIFREFEDVDPEQHFGRGDVKYHLGYSNDWVTESGQSVHLSLCFNPSHLEYVNPVALGRMRAKQDRHGDTERQQGMVVLIHGDAAFAGEGVVQETLNLSELDAYTVGGTVHVVVNNQLGFTTGPNEGRSSTYCTDVARMLQIPIFHVNGEHPEAVAQVISLAMDFRLAFRRDVVIDMYCYRLRGHNEGDEPSFTQPVMYRRIEQQKSVRENYLEHLLELEGVSRDEAEQIAVKRREQLEEELETARRDDYAHVSESFGGIWEGYAGGYEKDVPDVETGWPDESGKRKAESGRRKTGSGEETGVAESADVASSAVTDAPGSPGPPSAFRLPPSAPTTLSELLLKQTEFPEDFHPHPKIERGMKRRRQMAEGKKPLDWSAAEALALATLAVDGYRIRLTGQDSERGTFSQRHAVLHDHEDGHRYVPLQHLAEDQGPVEIANSPLSENGVLGFEYGYSLDWPDGLVMWEAQFGDFVNAAQVIIDQFIASAEDKWRRLSGLVLLLPHGFEGQGPEHSSARLERFLLLSAEDNIQVAVPTTPAQYFHLLRRQVLRPWRKPLVVMTPKSLLRQPEAVSSLEELEGGAFQRVIGDKGVAGRMESGKRKAESGGRKVDGKTNPQSADVRRVLLCSGKIYYELDDLRSRMERPDVAVVRVEQLHPFPEEELDAALAPYADDTPVFWLQEEPENMGAWRYVKHHCGERLFDRFPLQGITRPASASPATGSKTSHKMEQSDLFAQAFGTRRG